MLAGVGSGAVLCIGVSSLGLISTKKLFRCVPIISCTGIFLVPSHREPVLERSLCPNLPACLPRCLLPTSSLCPGVSRASTCPWAIPITYFESGWITSCLPGVSVFCVSFFFHHFFVECAQQIRTDIVCVTSGTGEHFVVW